MKNNYLKRRALFRLNFEITKVGDLFTLKGGVAMMNILKGMFIAANATVTSGRIRMIAKFIWHVKHLMKTQGPKGTVLYLKAAGVTLQQSLGGHKVENCGKLGMRISRTRKGIPRFIPSQLRMLIRKGDPLTIKLALTLINCYRVMEFPGTLKLATITKPFSGTAKLDYELVRLMPRFVSLFIGTNRPTSLLARFSRENLPVLWKSGPGVIGAFGHFNSHPYVLMRQLQTLKGMKTLHEQLATLWSYMPPKFSEAWTAGLKALENLRGPLAGMIKPIPYIGKLSTKAEAAGKIRVFAMVDAWTQWTLRPLHLLYFKLLEGIPMDGTFDQLAPAMRLVGRARSLHSLDLSAATDRLPVWLQQSLMGVILNHDFAGAWRNLLVGRVYRLHNNKSFIDLTYAVGQPMGALSSWASLAIVHHFIVQVAAWRSGFPVGRLFKAYAILGDDIIIANKRVAEEYLRILDTLGVECGLHKSLISPKGMAAEFAKRTFLKGIDVSPLPIKEFHAASKHLGAALEFRKKYGLSLAQLMQAFGVGWKVRSWLNKPLGKLPSRVRLLILAASIPVTTEEIKQFFDLGKPKRSRYQNDALSLLELIIPTEADKLMLKLWNDLQSNAAKFNPKARAMKMALQMVTECLGYSQEPEETLNDTLNRALDDGVITDDDSEDAIEYLTKALTKLLEITWVDLWTELKDKGERDIKRLGAIDRTDFPGFYKEFLEITADVAARNQNAFAIVRPNPPEIRGLMTPAQVRFWKRWSGLLQGTQKLVIASPNLDKANTDSVETRPTS